MRKRTRLTIPAQPADQNTKDMEKASLKYETEVQRLAALPGNEYERERKTAAKLLGVRVRLLDGWVARARDKTRAGADRALILAEPELISEPVDGAVLLSSIAAAFRRHVAMSDDVADTMALWSLHTYFLDCFVVSPRLAVISAEKGCGKTTLLDVLSKIVCRPMQMDNVTPAAIFRVVEVYRPTLLIDEADTFLKETGELRGILNSGHRRDGVVVRAAGANEFQTFSTYSACAIAQIGKLPGTLADRSIPIQLERRLQTEAIEAFRFDRTGQLDQLKRQQTRWALDNADQVRAVDPAIPDGIINRAADNWRPLLAIADVAGDPWPDRARRAMQRAVEANRNDAMSVRVELLADIQAVFTELATDRLSSARLVDELVALEGHPWAEGQRGKQLTNHQLARLLAPNGIRPGTIRIGDYTPKGYKLEQFGDAFARYLPHKVAEPPQRHKRERVRIS